MKAQVRTNLGGVEYIFDVDEKSSIETLHLVSVLGNPPTVCDECKNDNPAMFKLFSNKDSEANTYVNVQCKKCGANAKLGLYKSGGFFWHAFKKYVRTEK